MEADDQVLNQLSKNADVSQRQLATATNLSLGQLNLILHRLVSKGLLKIERINARKLKYVLTPQGIAFNTKRTYDFVRRAIQQTALLQQAFLNLVNKHSDDVLYLPQDEDEVYFILNLTRQEKKLSNVSLIRSIQDLKPEDNKSVIVWTVEQEASCQERKLAFINVLKFISI